MASSRRIERVRGLLREVVAEIVERELQFPEGALVTVTRVEPSPDLYYATAFVSVLGGDAAAERLALEEFRRQTGFVQRAVNRRLRMRPVPKITFAVDADEKRRERVEQLLAEQDRRQNGD